MSLFWPDVHTRPDSNIYLPTKAHSSETKGKRLESIQNESLGWLADFLRNCCVFDWTFLILRAAVCYPVVEPQKNPEAE
jgi:hypothetical protein